MMTRILIIAITLCGLNLPTGAQDAAKPVDALNLKQSIIQPVIDEHDTNFGRADLYLTERLTLISKPPAYWSLLSHSLQITHDSANVLYTIRQGQQIAVMFNNRLEPTYQRVTSARISPNSQRFAYLARRDNLWWLVVNGKNTLTLPPKSQLLFSPDSNRTAYIATEGTHEVVVVNGHVGLRFDDVDHHSLQFSPDSSAVAYTATRDDQTFVVEHARTNGPYDKVRGKLLFSPNASQTAFVAQSGKYWFVVLNGQTSQKYLEIGAGPIFSHDSSQLVYWAKRLDHRWVLVRNGFEDLNYEGDDYQDLVFSPTDNRIATFVKRSGKWWIVVDAIPVLSYDAVAPNTLTFSPDARHIAFVARFNNQWCIVKDYQKHPPYDQIRSGSIQFSPDSRRMAYAGFRDGKWTVVLDGYEKERFDRINPETFRFSHDSNRFVYVGIKNGQHYTVIDRNPTPPSEENTSPVIGPGVNHVAWWAKNDSHWSIVVNGIKSKETVRVPIPASNVIFDSPNALHSVVIRGSNKPACYRLDLEVNRHFAQSLSQLQTESPAH